MLTHGDGGHLITRWEWDVPLTEMRGEEVWQALDARITGRRRIPSGGLLRRFLVAAEQKSPRVTATFVQQYGLLGLCQHGQVIGWPGHPCPEPEIRDTDEGAFYVEQLEQWRQWASRFQHTRRFADLVRHPSMRPKPDQLIAAYAGAIAGLDEDAKRGDSLLHTMSRLARHTKRVHVQTRALADLLNRLLAAAYVRRAVHITAGHKLELRDGPAGAQPLFGALVMELVGQVLGSVRQIQCRECGEPFECDDPRVRYCEDHRDRAAQQARYMRERRARLRAAGLNSRGKPLFS